MNCIDIDTQGMELPLNEEQISEFLERLLVRLEVSDKELSILFCDDQQMTEFNGRYRQKEGPTDILSFPQQETLDMDFPVDESILGDMIISADTLKRNAKYFIVEEKVELYRLLIHGTLHLLGHDHETNDSTEPMLLFQEALLEELSRGRGE